MTNFEHEKTVVEEILLFKIVIKSIHRTIAFIIKVPEETVLTRSI